MYLFLKFVKTSLMKIKPLTTEKEYKTALRRFESIFQAKPGTKEGDEVDALSVLIKKYEDEHYPIDVPDPIELIKYRMEKWGLKPKE